MHPIYDSSLVEADIVEEDMKFAVAIGFLGEHVLFALSFVR